MKRCTGYRAGHRHTPHPGHRRCSDTPSYPHTQSGGCKATGSDKWGVWEDLSLRPVCPCSPEPRCGRTPDIEGSGGHSQGGLRLSEPHGSRGTQMRSFECVDQISVCKKERGWGWLGVNWCDYSSSHLEKGVSCNIIGIL